jgi:hypothetical protein
MLPLLLAIATAAACDAPVSEDQLSRVIDLAGTAWVVMDRASFEQATQERREILPCLSEPVVPELAIQLHLHEALAWSLDRRSDLSRAAFRAILALQPEWELPLDMAPEHHRLRVDFAEAQQAVGEEARRPFAPPGDGTLLVDGLPARDVPADRPFVVQMLDRAGVVERTHYFTPGSDGEEGLSWWTYDGAQGGLSPAPIPGRASGRALLGGAAGAGVLAGGLYAIAATRARALEQGELECDSLPAARTQINQLVGASAGLGALGVGLGIAGVIVAF